MNANENVQESASQTKRILEYLMAGGTLTPAEAWRRFGTMRLGARIKDIEKITGKAPSRKRVKVTNADGKEVYVMQYSL